MGGTPNAVVILERSNHVTRIIGQHEVRHIVKPTDASV